MSSGAGSTPSHPSSAECTDRTRRTQRGFALLLVIWVLAILAVLAVGVATTMRSETRLARNLVDSARARALAEAGVARAEAALLETDPAARWPADGAPREISFDGGTVSIRIEDEGGKIDVNAAAPEMIRALCGEFAIERSTCAALVDGVVEHRRDTAPSPNAAPLQLRFGANQGFGGGAASGRDRQIVAFATLEELRQLPGVDRSTIAKLSPYLTVYSQSARIDPTTAPREVLLALPGVDRGEVDRLIAARSATGPTASPAPVLTGVGLFTAQGQLHAATIVAEARTDTGARFVRRAVIALTGIPLRPVQVLEWRQQLDVEEDDQP